MAQRQISYREAVAEAIIEEMTRDDRVFLMGEDIAVVGGAFGATKGILAAFGEERVMDTPISETAIVGYAVGAAMTGLRPVVEIMRCDWMTICMDEIVNQAAKMRYFTAGRPEMAMVIRTATEGGIGLGAQHSQSFEAWFAHIPGLKVVMPSTPYDVKGLLKSAIRDPNPVIFMEPIILYGTSGPVPKEDYTIPLGQADVKREGKDATIVCWGAVTSRVMNAAKMLADEGIDTEVIDIRTIRPLDIEAILASVRKTGRLVVAHEANKTGGFGAEIVAQVQEKAFDHLDAPIQRVAANDVLIPINRNLELMVLPREEQVIAGVKAVL
ncbi:MAG: alpha-ketoacid dehydrogenase subunit beta [Chloroflexi bacterium]|nr:alpha-ketoacid dehydrogenase subunit beta [Chloroflexota bacterium]